MKCHDRRGGSKMRQKPINARRWRNWLFFEGRSAGGGATGAAGGWISSTDGFQCRRTACNTDSSTHLRKSIVTATTTNMASFKGKSPRWQSDGSRGLGGVAQRGSKSHDFLCFGSDVMRTLYRLSRCRPTVSPAPPQRNAAIAPFYTNGRNRSSAAGVAQTTRGETAG